VGWRVKGAVGPKAASGVVSFAVSARYPDGGTLFKSCLGSLTWRATTA
jgi:hypothetical protein